MYLRLTFIHPTPNGFNVKTSLAVREGWACLIPKLECCNLNVLAMMFIYFFSLLITESKLKTINTILKNLITWC